MRSVQKSLRIPVETCTEIEIMAAETGRDFSAITKDLLKEGIRMRQCPGIVFSDSLNGRRARLAGTGIEVWELIATYMALEKQFARFQKTYHWLSENQLRTAIGYYRLFRDEIDPLIKQNDSWNLDRIDKTYPFLSREKM